MARNLVGFRNQIKAFLREQKAATKSKSNEDAMRRNVVQRLQYGYAFHDPSQEVTTEEAEKRDILKKQILKGRETASDQYPYKFYQVKDGKNIAGQGKPSGSETYY